MRKKLIYLMLLTVLLVYVGIFLYSPYYSLQRIDQAIDEKDSALLHSQINMPLIQEELKAFVESKLKVKMQIEAQRNINMAYTDYVFAKRFVDEVVSSLLSVYGFYSLLQGRIDYVDARNTKKMPANFLANQNVNIDSLTQAHLILDQPDGLQSKVMLKRIGLFSWRIDNIFFPVEQMLDNFVHQLKQEM